MRHAFTPGSRVAVLAVVPMASDGGLTTMWRKLVKELFDPFAPSCTTCAAPARSGARSTASPTRAEGIVSAKPRRRRILFVARPSK
jgi:hypothetical protein